jgi:4-hydroxybutyryl-CoA dehydratase/vinylacetyl-CoA-Delta-isomerase
MGVHAFMAAGIVAARMDHKLGTHYSDAVEDYRAYVMKNDLAVTGAITDVKGDRSLRPSRQEQHKDFYVRVVDETADGIVVRGAKMHISATPMCNEMIVSPCRAHQEEDKDYAVVFAVPLNAKGITIVQMPMTIDGATGEQANWDYPWHGNTAVTAEALLVFDDVFVPRNRVFMCGEWQFSRDIAWTFGTFHRLYSITHTVADTELFAGAAALMAEYNGLDKYSHIQEKLAMLCMHVEEIDALSKAACAYPDTDPDTGLVAPNLVYTNIAKFRFANERSEVSKLLGDITGGIASTAPSYQDWMNPEIRPFLERYLAAKEGIPTEHRLRAIRMAKELTLSGSYGPAGPIHYEGSLAAQKMALYQGGDWERYKAAAKRLARIPGWEEHPVFKDVPDPRNS